MAAISVKNKLALATTIIFWSSAFVGIRAGLESYSPGGLAALRFLIASACMLIVYLFFPLKSVIQNKDKILLLLIGGFGFGCYNITLNYGELAVPSGIASFIVSQSPIITMIVAVLFLGEGLSFYMIAGTLVSAVGVGLIMLSGEQHFNFQIGIVYLFLATIVSGFYSVLQKPFLKKYQAIEVAAYIIWGATLALVVYLPNMVHEIKHASWHATWSVIYLGIFPAAIGAITWSYALKEIPASQAVTFLYFMPIMATLIGWLWLGETLTHLALLGGIIALVGVWIASRPVERKWFTRR